MLDRLTSVWTHRGLDIETIGYSFVVGDTNALITQQVGLLLLILVIMCVVDDPAKIHAIQYLSDHNVKVLFD